MTESNTADLLVELGCEELPPKALATLARAFFDGVCAGLDDAGVGFDANASTYYFTPRRMALRLALVEARQPDRRVERRGPSVQAAFDTEGQPTRAATGFAASVGLEVDQLDRLATDKGEWLACTLDIPGEPLSALLFPILQQSLDKLPVPKPMRWSDHEFSFVRPVHWLVVLHGENVIDGELYGCAAGRLTRGHRIHSPGPHSVGSPADWLDILESAFVIGDHRVRRSRISESAQAVGQAQGGWTRVTDALLDEVCNLVEWPVAVVGRFEEDFLAVPPEALIASMESHQKFFPVLASEDGELTPAFVVMANLDSADPAEMVAGYERVVRPRLADARFFWEQDLKTPLGDRLEALDRIVFQEKLGSIGDKVRRIASVASKIASFSGSDAALAERAALLSKCDLVTQMVGEFPELQGIMGGHYARAEGEDPAVVDAVEAHYRPRYAGDDLPTGETARAVALADRLDTLVGIFATGMKPTGSKDPFALRRAALGVIRLLTEGELAIDLDELLAYSRDALLGQIEISDQQLAEVRGFILERLKHLWIEQGATTRQMNAVLAAPVTNLPDLRARLDAVIGFMAQPAAESLVAANKRIGNILKQAELSDYGDIDPDRFVLEEEGCLFDAVSSASSALPEQLASGGYAAVLTRLAELREPVDAYFDKVMVMDDDAGIRANRLAQLHALKTLFDGVADFAQAD
ncbi:glycine--tRNA ligase subunit beta [Marinihelvus fidelis]|uniref:Glycine--tRNA ligase beta subunit n=1 Tax=Marinihelvus fidelis TaxID=2613842 RepID=A0A5N0TCD3_9GAMM|nr:glycine--tRNA ligase subunit beta [Marinihelvus fidelis]KAA9131496.1 glycine--tRNA ligase subunit beta [Marinihelvus fidelis]